MWDALLELVHGLFTNGISWGGLLAFLIFLNKVQRSGRYKHWNRDVVNNQKIIMEQLGVGGQWTGTIETSLNEEARNLKKLFLPLRKAINQGKPRRKKNMSKLKSRKFWMTVISALLVVLNEGLGLGIDSETVLAFAGIVMSYILGQSHVDAKKEISESSNRFH